MPSIAPLKAEHNLYDLQRALTDEREPRPRAVTPTSFFPGSAGDRALLEELIVAHAPRIVFHTAAHKHVPLLEQQPLAAIVDNIFATPGLLVTRKLHPAEAGSRLALCIGAGEQIATSTFHGYNHTIAVTTRLLS